MSPGPYSGLTGPWPRDPTTGALLVSGSSSTINSSTGNRVVGLGNSITFGNSSADGQATRGDRDVLAWAHLFSDGQIQYVRNAGISGNKTDQILARVDADVIAYAPDWCILESGTNDAAAGYALATYSANMIAILAKLKAAGIRVLLWTPPPNPSTGSPNSRQLQDTYRVWMRYYAEQNKIPLADPFPLLVDPTTGGYLAGLDFGDGIHPNAAGAKIIGQTIATALAPHLGSWTPPLPGFQTTDSRNMLPGALFLTNTAGVGTGWGKAGSGVATVVAPSGSEILGNWQRLTDTVNEFTQITFAPTITTQWVVGDKLAFVGRVQNDSTGGQFAVGVNCTNGATPAFRPVSGFTVPVPAHTFYQEFVVPTGTTAMSVFLTVQGSTALDGRVGQIGLYNLTKLGIA